MFHDIREHACAIYSDFYSCKTDNFQLKNDDFLIFAQKIDCGYILEQRQWGSSNKYPQFCFIAKIR